MICKKMFQIFSSCRGWLFRFAFLITEPRSPEVQYCYCETSSAARQGELTSITMYILSSCGSLIFCTSWTMFLCFNDSRMALDGQLLAGG